MEYAIVQSTNPFGNPFISCTVTQSKIIYHLESNVLLNSVQKVLVPSSKNTHCVSTENRSLMLFKAVITLDSQNHTKLVSTLWRKN
jgi:hypothetical protein